jgi:hypothetical protein
MPILSNFTLQRELLVPPDSLERREMRRTEPYEKKRARQISDAESMAKQIRRNLQGIPGENMNPEMVTDILLKLGFRAEHQRYVMGGVHVNLDFVHGTLKGNGNRHLDLESTQDGSKAKVYYFA